MAMANKISLGVTGNAGGSEMFGYMPGDVSHTDSEKKDRNDAARREMIGVLGKSVGNTSAKKWEDIKDVELDDDDARAKVSYGLLESVAKRMEGETADYESNDHYKKIRAILDEGDSAKKRDLLKNEFNYTFAPGAAAGAKEKLGEFAKRIEGENLFISLNESFAKGRRELAKRKKDADEKADDAESKGDEKTEEYYRNLRRELRDRQFGRSAGAAMYGGYRFENAPGTPNAIYDWMTNNDAHLFAMQNGYTRGMEGEDGRVIYSKGGEKSRSGGEISGEKFDKMIDAVNRLAEKMDELEKRIAALEKGGVKKTTEDGNDKTEKGDGFEKDKNFEAAMDQLKGKFSGKTSDFFYRGRILERIAVVNDGRKSKQEREQMQRWLMDAAGENKKEVKKALK
jgi:ketosteroid isomerase-like protein